MVGWGMSFDNGESAFARPLRRDCAAVRGLGSAAGRSDYFAKASAVALRAMADESAGGRYCAKMLRKAGLEGPIYVSAKRTQIIWRAEQGLSDCGGNGSDGNWRSKNLG